jgi:SpoVK/Ycf46/Vps4 family AAA+-type ATPase
MDELAKLLASRRDARVAVIGPAEVVSKYIGETKKSLDEGFYSAEEGAAILVFNPRATTVSAGAARSTAMTARSYSR